MEALGPKLEKTIVNLELIDDRKVLEIVRKETMVGVLPQPHPLHVSLFVFSDNFQIWLKSYMWGCFYLKSIQNVDPDFAKICPSIWAGTKVAIFIKK